MQVLGRITSFVALALVALALLFAFPEEELDSSIMFGHVTASSVIIPLCKHPYFTIPLIAPQTGFPPAKHIGRAFSEHTGFPLTQLVGKLLVVVFADDSEAKYILTSFGKEKTKSDLKSLFKSATEKDIGLSVKGNSIEGEKDLFPLFLRIENVLLSFAEMISGKQSPFKLLALRKREFPGKFK